MVNGTLQSEFFTMFWPMRLTYSVTTGSVMNLVLFSISMAYILPILISVSVEYQYPMPRPPMSRFPTALTSSTLPGLMLIFWLPGSITFSGLTVLATSPATGVVPGAGLDGVADGLSSATGVVPGAGSFAVGEAVGVSAGAVGAAGACCAAGVAAGGAAVGSACGAVCAHAVVAIASAKPASICALDVGKALLMTSPLAGAHFKSVCAASLHLLDASIRRTGSMGKINSLGNQILPGFVLKTIECRFRV